MRRFVLFLAFVLAFFSASCFDHGKDPKPPPPQDTLDAVLDTKVVKPLEPLGVTLFDSNPSVPAQGYTLEIDVGGVKPITDSWIEFDKKDHFTVIVPPGILDATSGIVPGEAKLRVTKIVDKPTVVISAWESFTIELGPPPSGQTGTATAALAGAFVNQFIAGTGNAHALAAYSSIYHLPLEEVEVAAVSAAREAHSLFAYADKVFSGESFSFGSLGSQKATFDGKSLPLTDQIAMDIAGALADAGNLPVPAPYEFSAFFANLGLDTAPGAPARYAKVMGGVVRRIFAMVEQGVPLEGGKSILLADSHVGGLVWTATACFGGGLSFAECMLAGQATLGEDNFSQASYPVQIMGSSLYSNMYLHYWGPYQGLYGSLTMTGFVYWNAISRLVYDLSVKLWQGFNLFLPKWGLPPSSFALMNLTISWISGTVKGLTWPPAPGEDIKLAIVRSDGGILSFSGKTDAGGVIVFTSVPPTPPNESAMYHLVDPGGTANTGMLLNF